MSDERDGLLLIAALRRATGRCEGVRTGSATSGARGDLYSAEVSLQGQPLFSARTMGFRKPAQKQAFQTHCRSTLALNLCISIECMVEGLLGLFEQSR